MLKITSSSCVIKEDSTLLICLPSFGCCGLLASHLLTKNDGFEKIGIFYSNYLNQTIGSNIGGEVSLNSEVYYNKEANIILLSLYSTVLSRYAKKFFEDLNTFVESHKVIRVLVASGVLNLYVKDDSELFNKSVDCFVVCNDDGSGKDEYQKVSVRSFDQFLTKKDDSSRDAQLKEFDLIEGQDFAKKALKFFKSKNKSCDFIFVFANNFLDFYGTLGLYLKLKHILRISNDTNFSKVVRDESQSLEHVIKALLSTHKLSFDTELVSFFTATKTL